MVEVFCGHAGMSAAFRGQGFEVMAVDWESNRHKPRVPVTRLNLLEDSDYEKLVQILRSGDVVVI